MQIQSQNHKIDIDFVKEKVFIDALEFIAY